MPASRPQMVRGLAALGTGIVLLLSFVLTWKYWTLATGDARDVFKCDTFVYLVGVVAPYQSDMFVVSVANPLQPRLIGQSRGDGWTYGVCVASPFSCAYTCDGWEGIHVRSLVDPANPVVDTDV